MTIRPSRSVASTIEPADRFFTRDEMALMRDREEWENEGGSARPSRSWLDSAGALPPALHASDDSNSRKGHSDV
jgi:hypothetical protein